MLGTCPTGRSSRRTTVTAPCGCASPLLARDLPCGDVEPIPDVDTRDSDDQRCECLLVIVPGGLVPDFIRHGIRPIAEPGCRLSKRQRGPLSVGEVGRLTPGCYREEALVCLAEFSGNARMLDGADAAAVDLARPQIDQLKRLWWNATLLNDFSQGLESLHRARNNHCWVVHSCLHGVCSFRYVLNRDPMDPDFARDGTAKRWFTRPSAVTSVGL